MFNHLEKSVRTASLLRLLRGLSLLGTVLDQSRQAVSLKSLTWNDDKANVLPESSEVGKRVTESREQLLHMIFLKTLTSGEVLSP